MKTLDSEVSLRDLETIAMTLKRNMLRTINQAHTGHLGACCSSVELMTALYFGDILNFDRSDPRHPDRDYVLVRGHLGPLRYNLFALLGWMDESEMSHYREFGSRLAGHEDMRLTPGVDLTPSGSLGMLLSYGVGARHSFRQRGLENKVFCFLGDGEEQEGNVSEAARHASSLNLDRLIVIMDQNEKQLSTATRFTDGSTDVRRMWEGYGWNVFEVKDGHDLREVHKCYTDAVRSSKAGPVCIIAKTIKGNGIDGAEESYNGYHVYHNTTEDQKKNNVPIGDEIDRLSGELGRTQIVIPDKKLGVYSGTRGFAPVKCIEPDVSEERVTSYEYLYEFLSKLAVQEKSRNIYVLTADYPPRSLIYDKGRFAIEGVNYCNVGVREQHVLSMAHGIRTVEPDSLILVLCGDAFAYRFADQLNVLAQSDDRVVVYAVQAGLSGAKNGSTHQSSGQPGMALTMPKLSFYEPSSKRDWFYVMNEAVNNPGPSFVRTHQPNVPFDFGCFKPAPFYTIPVGDGVPDCTIVSNGMIIGDALEAARMLNDEGLSARVINVLNPKQMGGISDLVEGNKPVFVVYNGNPCVLGYGLCRDLAMSKERPSKIIETGFELGRTGSISDLMRHFKLDKDGIYEMVKREI